MRWKETRKKKRRTSKTKYQWSRYSGICVFLVDMRRRSDYLGCAFAKSHVQIACSARDGPFEQFPH